MTCSSEAHSLPNLHSTTSTLDCSEGASYRRVRRERPRRCRLRQRRCSLGTVHPVACVPRHQARQHLRILRQCQRVRLDRHAVRQRLHRHVRLWPASDRLHHAALRLRHRKRHEAGSRLLRERTVHRHRVRSVHRHGHHRRHHLRTRGARLELHVRSRVRSRQLPLPDAVHELVRLYRGHGGLHALHGGSGHGQRQAPRVLGLLLQRRRPAQPHLVRWCVHCAALHDRFERVARQPADDHRVRLVQQRHHPERDYRGRGVRGRRTPWPGDFGVSTHSKLVTLNNDNLLAVRHAINSLYAIQNTTNGQFAYAGTPIAPRVQLAGINSDTYHIWTLIALADYATLTADTEFVKNLWDQALFGFEFILGNVDSSDMLLNVTGVYDWGRVGQGGKNIAANSLLYHALYSYAELAAHLGLEVPSYNGSAFGELASAVKTAVNSNLWDDSVGLYRDNTTAGGAELHPQDGNSLAVRYNLTQSSEQAATVSENLVTRWNKYGAVSPEGLGSISPFITSVEVEAHLRATPGNASLALEIIRRQWGYMLDHFSNSTTIEAYYETGELMYPFYGLELGNYISHAHAWSTGPTASLTLHVGGLSPVTDAGKTWEFVPHAAGADVDELHTGYTLATGDFSVEWTTKNEDSFFFANLETPRSTTGFISVPTFGKSLDAIEISINGNTVWANGAASWSGFGAASGSADFVTVAEVPYGGWFSIVAKDA